MPIHDPEQFIVPQFLDEPPKVLLFDMDVALITMAFIGLGVVAGWAITFTIIGVSISLIIQKLKGAQHKGFLIHILHWYTPVKIFKRTPPSSMRHFIS